jgi:transketolase
VVIDGHDLAQILDALGEARRTKQKPTVILAKTEKGHGVSFLAGAPNWHGKAVKKGDELQRAITELEAQVVPEEGATVTIPRPAGTPRPERVTDPVPPKYTLGDQVATREAFGAALAQLADTDSRVVALDADVKNSTFSEKFEAAHPDRFYQCFIAEQAMVGAAMGLAARGAVPFPSTFAAFFTRAADFIRMAAISNLNVKLVGTHAGVSIGEDGPSQMALEDLAMATAQPNFAVLYPSDAVAAAHLVCAAARHRGPVYLRTSRPKTPVIYDNHEVFDIGGLKVLRRSSRDKATVVAAGVTLFEALKAYDVLLAEGVHVRVIDLYSLQPIDAAGLITAGRETGRLITVEDHYASGGIGDAVSRAVAPAGLAVTRLAVADIPRSGKPDELLDHFGISARRIVASIRE